MKDGIEASGIALSISAAVFVGALAAGGAAHAATFGFTDTVQTYDVPTTGVYDITAAGGQGGFIPDLKVVFLGGEGAVVGGDAKLTAGEMLIILVGAEGITAADGDTGGGGGTFVSLAPAGPNHPTNLLVVAGGGGGGNGGGGASLASGPGTGAGGGAALAIAGVGGGGGFLGGGTGGDAGGASYSGGIAAGGTAADGANGGAGGAGGGAGGSITVSGGGGGYTGGAAAQCPDCGGSGGTSYLAQSMTELVSVGDGNLGDGYVTVNFVGPAAPEPATWTMLLIGFASLAYAGYRKALGATTSGLPALARRA
jgi:hypothetical protein